MPFLIIGDANADIIAPAPIFPTEGDDVAIERLIWASGGSAANVAAGLALLGAPSRLLARIGSDPAAEVALRAARHAGVDLAHVQRDASVPTGICYAVISPGGERTFLSFRGANVGMDEAEGAALYGATWLHVAGHALLEGQQRATAIALLEQATHQHVPVSLDLCLPLVRQHPQWLRALLPQLQIVFGNAREVRELEVDIGPGLLVIKQGADGCELRGSAHAKVPGFTTTVIDTNGCGDAFIAGFLASHRAGHTFEHCAVVANAAGALTATRSGAADALPSYTELSAFLAEQQAQGAI